MNRMDIPWVQLIWHAHYQNHKLPQSSGPCGSFWWKDCLSLMDNFLTHLRVTPGTGNTIRLWRDNWNGTALVRQYPHLCSYAKQESISLHEATAYVLQGDVYDLFHTPLSDIAMQQYNNFAELLAMRADLQGKDAWQVPGSTAVYKSSKLYKLLRQFPAAPKPFQ